MRIAVVQQEGNPGHPYANRQKALSFASQALDQAADVILFHEGLLAGYGGNPLEASEPADGQTSQAFQRLLTSRDSLIIYGLTERVGDTYYQSAPVVSATGIVANYRKTHLWWNSEGVRHEPGYFSAGNRLVTFEFKGIRFGIMICYDGDFPEMTRAYAGLNCSVLFWLNNRNSRGHAEVKSLAQTNSMIIATSCCCGLNETGHPCGGGSNITDAEGSLLTDIWNEEGVIFADVDACRAQALRENNPWFRGQRPELYYEPMGDNQRRSNEHN